MVHVPSGFSMHFVEGAGFEPAVFKGTLAITIHIIKHRACLRPLGQPSLSSFFASLLHRGLNSDRLLLVKSYHSASQLHDLADAIIL